MSGDFKSPQEMRAIREAERQKLREAGVEPISDHLKLVHEEDSEPEKRIKWKDSGELERDPWESIENIKRWIEVGEPDSDAIERELQRLENRILAHLTPKLRKLIEYRDFMRMEYRKRYYKDWVDDD